MEEKIIIQDITQEAAEPSQNSSSPPPRKKHGKGKRTTITAKPDKYIWGIYIMLLIISIIELYSASSSMIKSSNIYKPLIEHVIFLAGGFLIVLGCQSLHYKWFKKYATFLFIVTLIVLAYSTFYGADINGAKRAIRILGITIQPPEIVKLTTVLFLAMLLGTRQEPGGVRSVAVFWAAFAVLLVGGLLWYNGLTNAVLLMTVSLAMFVIAGVQWRKIGIVLAVYAVFGGIVYEMKYAGGKEKENTEFAQAAGTNIETDAPKEGGRQDTHKGRISRFLNGISPTDTITDENRQVMFANFAQAHGGLIGQGPGNSRESARLPLAFSDYIYSIVVEDTGFVGGVALLLLYLCLIARAGRVASRCNRAFPALLIMGCAVLIVLQAAIHMVIVVGGPVSGQPLPLISKGGTSVLVMSAAIGMMLSVSKYAVTNGDKKDINAELNNLPEDMRAANPTQLSNL